MPKRRIDPKVKEQVIVRLRAGTRPIDIVRQFGVSESTVFKIRRELEDQSDREDKTPSTPGSVATLPARDDEIAALEARVRDLEELNAALVRKLLERI